jgi:hypothetical protein
MIDDKIIDELESMTLDQIRQKLANKEYGAEHGRNYQFILSWLSRWEKLLQETKESEAISLAREANASAKEANRIASSALALTESEVRLARRSRRIDRIIPAVAIIIAAIAAREDIKWLIQTFSTVLKKWGSMLLKKI